MGYKGKVRLKKRWIFTLVFLSMGVLLIATHSLYLSALGKFLVVSDPLAKVDALVVLDGDYPEHERLLHAVQLWQQGYAPRIILSAKLADWQTYEDYPAWRHAMKLNMFCRCLIRCWTQCRLDEGGGPQTSPFYAGTWD